MYYPKNKLIIILTIIIISFNITLSGIDHDYFLQKLLTTASDNPPDPPLPRESIYEKNEILYCSGKLKIAQENNKAADLMEKGNFATAAIIYEKALKHAALFFPFRYNLGLCYLHTKDYRRSLLHLNKAALIFPEYSKTYLQIGYVYERQGIFTEAINFFKKALKINSREIMTFIRIGDLFYSRGQTQVAKKYYKASLKNNPAFSNGLIGLAKIHFKNKEYIKTLTQLKTVNISGDYDKSYHYYFAETYFKLQEYGDATIHYSELLKYKNDKFFLTNSYGLIQHKLNLSKRFSE